MKRAPELIPLSREHHEALVLARRACEPERADPARLRVHVLRRWDAQALPEWGAAMRDHVKWEERFLFPRAEQLLDLAALGAALERPEETPCHP